MFVFSIAALYAGIRLCAQLLAEAQSGSLMHLIQGSRQILLIDRRDQRRLEDLDSSRVLGHNCADPLTGNSDDKATMSILI